MTNYFHVFHLFYVQKSHFLSPVLSHRRTHRDMHTRGDAHRNVSSLPCEFISKIILQLKSYMTFHSSKVLEAVRLKDSLLVEMLNTAERRTDAGIHMCVISLSLSLSLITALACISMAQASVISSKMAF